MPCILNFLNIEITTDSIITFFCKLYKITSNPTESIKNTILLLNLFMDFIVFRIYFFLAICNLFGNMFRHRLRSNRVPTFVINHNPSVKLAKKKISLLPKLFEMWLFGYKIILKVISFRTTISIKIVLMRFKNCFSSLNNY